MYEGSNKIEMYSKINLFVQLGMQELQASLVDATSTNFDIVNDPIQILDRNFPLNWTATNEGWDLFQMVLILTTSVQFLLYL